MARTAFLGACAFCIAAGAAMQLGLGWVAYALAVCAFACGFVVVEAKS